ncbi:MAG TPA: tetratricopeptide repeat protein [Firmicutes bacterium]|nr:tetratricopeptide repeat protein [Bacillota bacterium]
MARADRTLLAKRIKNRRLELGLTQRDLAGNDFTRGFISQIENGIIDPSLKSLEKIAERLGLTLSALLDNPNSHDPIELEGTLNKGFHIMAQDLNEADKIATDVLDKAVEMNNHHLMGRAYSLAAWVSYYKKDYVSAAKLFSLAADAHRKASNVLLAARCLNSAGAASHVIRDFTKAEEYYKSAIELLQDMNDPSQNDYIRAMVNYGILLADFGDYARAISVLDKSLRISVRLNDYYKYGQVRNALGVAYRKLGQIDHAIRHYYAALFFSRAIEDELHIAMAANNLAIALGIKGELNQARSLLVEAIELFKKLERPAMLANAQSELAKIAWSAGDVETAEQNCREAISNLKNNQDLGEMKLLLARILASRNELEPAAEAYKESLDILSKSQDDASIAEICYEAGNVFLKLGKPEEASHYLARAADSYRKMSK